MDVLYAGDVYLWIEYDALAILADPWITKFAGGREVQGVSA